MNRCSFNRVGAVGHRNGDEDLLPIDVAPVVRLNANISKWKPARIEALRQLLKGNVDLGEAQQFEITRSKPV